ncbi:hypothetical protein FQN60_012552, partial [Etheostoma spectabile]
PPGKGPTPTRGSLVVVTFNSRVGGPWSGRIVGSQGVTVALGITPTPNAIVGRYRTYVAVVMGTGMLRTKRNAATDLYVLFNAWCKDDDVFLPNEAERNEYVLNDHGVMYQGSYDDVNFKDWVYGQDDNGVCVGNWSDNFSMGRSPTSWTGSVEILLQYAQTGVPVSFAQCWVFAGVFNTFLRALGIPARTITNFNSAHDSNGNLKTDLIFLPDGSPDTVNTRDSIWNYHCWNEVFIRRYDLPPGLGGWQAVDATPQETSDGSAEDHRTMARADEYGLERDQSELPETTLSVFINASQVNLGKDVIVQVDFLNQSNVPTTIQANLTGSVIFYTGIRASYLKNHNFTITVPANQRKSEMMKITAAEYVHLLGTQRCLHFVVSGQAEDEALSGVPKVQQEMFAKVTFTNPFNFALQACSLSMEGAGVMREKTRFYRVIEPQTSISWKESFNPQRAGKRCLVAVMDCSNLCESCVTPPRSSSTTPPPITDAPD